MKYCRSIIFTQKGKLSRVCFARKQKIQHLFDLFLIKGDFPKKISITKLEECPHRYSTNL